MALRIEENEQHLAAVKLFELPALAGQVRQIERRRPRAEGQTRRFFGRAALARQILFDGLKAEQDPALLAQKLEREPGEKAYQEPGEDDANNLDDRSLLKDAMKPAGDSQVAISGKNDSMMIRECHAKEKWSGHAHKSGPVAALLTQSIPCLRPLAFGCAAG
jgi:hypothetical protein